MPKLIDHDEARDTIADAYVRVISARGSASVTMREIAREAGCSQTLPHYYFDNRQALVEFAFARQADMAVAALQAVASGPAPVADRLRATISWLIDRASSSASIWRTVIGMIVEDNPRSRISELDRACYHRFLDTLTALIADFAASTAAGLDARAEAILLLTSTDGLALATASLGSEAGELIAPLRAICLERHGLLPQ